MATNPTIATGNFAPSMAPMGPASGIDSGKRVSAPAQHASIASPVELLSAFQEAKANGTAMYDAKGVMVVQNIGATLTLDPSGKMTTKGSKMGSETLTAQIPPEIWNEVKNELFDGKGQKQFIA